MEMTINGTGRQSDVEMQVDNSHRAARFSIRPLEHVFDNKIGGHFAVTAISGTIAASLGASSELFSARWTDGSRLKALLRLTAGVGVYTAAQTVANPLELEAIVARSFTTDYTTNSTNIVPSSAGQKMRSSTMNGSLYNANNGIKICTTTGMTGSVKTLDTAGIGAALYPGNALGVGDTKDLYRWDPTTHPLILGANEGIVIRNIGAFGAAATYKLIVTMLWAEIDEL